MEYARKCDKCQRFSPMSKAHLEKLISMTIPWSFTVWGIDLIGQLSKGRGNIQYTIVAVDCFTKWVEVEALTSITLAKIKEFIYNNIVGWYGVPHTIVSNNDTQFDCEEFRNFCDHLQIKKVFTSIARPQANGKVETVRRSSTTWRWNLKTWREDGLMSYLRYQWRTTRYFNSKVKTRIFQIGDLVLRKVLYYEEALDPSWEGPYKIARIFTPSAYQLVQLNEDWVPSCGTQIIWKCIINSYMHPY